MRIAVKCALANVTIPRPSAGAPRIDYELSVAAPTGSLRQISRELTSVARAATVEAANSGGRHSANLGSGLLLALGPVVGCSLCNRRVSRTATTSAARVPAASWIERL